MQNEKNEELEQEQEDDGIEVEKTYSKHQVVQKLRRLADALEAERTFEIKIGGNRVYMPSTANVTFEYELEEGESELEIEFKWKSE